MAQTVPGGKRLQPDDYVEAELVQDFESESYPLTV